MKKTLLKIVQDILSSLESDSVNSISDTPESIIVSDCVRTTYEDISAGKNWSYLKSNLIVSAYGVDKPTHCKLPDNIKEVLYINYDKRKALADRKSYLPVEFVTSDDFLRRTNGRNSLDSTVVTVSDISGMDLFIKNNSPPSFYTSFDNTYIVFDSYNVDIEDTIMSSKIQGEGYFLKDWIDSDDFVPDMPPEMFPLLESRAGRAAFISLKQTDNPLFAQRERRQARAMSIRESNVKTGDPYPNYGRRKSK